MNLYHIILFFHITGTIMLFIAWSVEYVQISKIKATVTAPISVGNPCSLQKKRSRNSMMAMALTLGTGIWLMLLFGSHAAWMHMAMIALVLIIVIGLFLFRVASKFRLNPGKRYQLLASSIKIRLSIGIGIIALMVFKPLTFPAALAILIFSLIAGLIWFWTTRNFIKA